MDTSKLNALDGDAMYQEVLTERIERSRKLYKTALKNAVVRNESAQKVADKANARADKNQKVLDELVIGGMEGFFAKEDVYPDDDEGIDIEDISPDRPVRPVRPVRKY